MRYLIITFALVLGGCSWPTKSDPCIPEYKIIWKAPEFTMPDRPILRSETQSTNDGDAVRNVELDFIDITDYATQLENILYEIKKK